MRTTMIFYASRFKYSYPFLSIITFAGLQNTASAKTASIGSAVNWGNADKIVVNRQVKESSVTEAYLQLACIFDHTKGYNLPLLPCSKSQI